MEGNKNRNNNKNKWLAPSVTTQTQKETIAASALLLFLSPPHPLSLSSRNGDDSLSTSSSCVSDACSSALIGTQVDQICRDPLRVLALAAFQFFLNPKVSKKSRSKNHRRKKLISNICKMRVVYDLLSSRNRDEDDDAPAVFTLHENTTPAAFLLPETTTTAASSSVAEITSVTTKTSTRIRFTKDREASSSSTVTSTKSSSQKARASKTVKRRADDILSWLSGNGCASEVKIRTAIGDSPDTSKALRWLVKEDEVKRIGAGGRSDPFLYMVASKKAMES